MKAFLKTLIPSRYKPLLRVAWRKVYWWGFRYTCPCCRSRIRTLLPFGSNLPVLNELQVIGGGYRQHSCCPVCRSFDRERLVYLFLIRNTDIFKRQMKVLHVAPEARVSRLLADRENIDYITADLYSGDVKVRMDIGGIPFPNNSFSAIICNHVLEHVVDDRRAIAELYRTLTSGGWAILQVPMSLALKRTYEDSSISTPAGREAAFGQADHVRVYASDYQDRLERAGFKVEVFRWTSHLEEFGGPKNIFGLNEHEAIFVAHK